jgi:hypothetical protein
MKLPKETTSLNRFVKREKWLDQKESRDREMDG